MKAYKIVVIGDKGVGKTSIISKYLDNQVSERATIGVDFRSITLENGKELVIWDIGGQERFTSVAKAYLTGAKLSVLVYDVNSPESLSRVKKWAELLVKANNGSEISGILVGNKIDLGKKIDPEKINEFMQSCPVKILYHIETSAVTGERIKDLFKKISDFFANSK